MGRVRPEVDPNRTQLQDFGGRPSTPQDGVHPRQELLQLEGLRDVVVGAQVQATDFVVLVAPRRNDQHGRAAVASQCAAQFEAIHTGQHDVEDDEVRQERARVFKSLRRPSPTTRTSKPSNVRFSRNTVDRFASSSTTRTRLFIGMRPSYTQNSPAVCYRRVDT